MVSAPPSQAEQTIARLRWMPPELAARLARGGGSAYSVLPLFFLLGLLLAFTPCVLPMLPVVAAMVAGAPGIGRRRSQRWRSFGLVSAYVLSLALAWALAGLFVGTLGSTLQGTLQQPLALVAVATLFLLLGMTMIGLIEMPQLRVQSAVDDDKRPPLTGMGGAVILGALSALVLSPCVSPALVGALLYLAQGGSALWGAAALFVMGLGMGVPLLLLAVGGRHLLPQPGPWLLVVRQCIGLLLLVVGLWLFDRIFPASATWATAGALALVFATWWWDTSRAAAGTPWQRRLAAMSLVAVSVAMFHQAATSEGAPFPGSSSPAPENTAAAHSKRGWTQIANVGELQRALTASGQPTVLFVSADWCTVCERMERGTFEDAAVRALLAKGQRLYLDVSAGNTAARLLMANFQLFGPPALLFFDDAGRELPMARRIGYVSATELVALAKPLFDRGAVPLGQAEPLDSATP